MKQELGTLDRFLKEAPFTFIDNFLSFAVELDSPDDYDLWLELIGT